MAVHADPKRGVNHSKKPQTVLTGTIVVRFRRKGRAGIGDAPIWGGEYP
jgi:hypothetical protein